METTPATEATVAQDRVSRWEELQAKGREVGREMGITEEAQVYAILND
jgi:hypothetical protein